MDLEDAVTMETELKDMEEWDSLSIVGYVAFANASLGKTIPPAVVRTAETIEDLYNLLK